MSPETLPSPTLSRPNIITLSSALSALAVESWDTSLDLLKEARKREMQPNAAGTRSVSQAPIKGSSPKGLLCRVQGLRGLYVEFQGFWPYAKLRGVG